MDATVAIGFAGFMSRVGFALGTDLASAVWAAACFAGAIDSEFPSEAVALPASCATAELKRRGRQRRIRFRRSLRSGRHLFSIGKRRLELANQLRPELWIALFQFVQQRSLGFGIETTHRLNFADQRRELTRIGAAVDGRSRILHWRHR